ncbi:MAG: aldo/keto reductase [Bacteroidota bacterium]
MKYRTLGKTGWKISEVSLGTWQVGGKWGSSFDDKLAESILHKAIDGGVNFLDTADVYSAGLSEKAVSRVVKSRHEEIFVATKCGRRLHPHTAEGYNRQNITAFIHDSLQNMGLERIDLVQLHCPPTEVYQQDEVFGILDDLKAEGKIREYGVSVEKVSEAMEAIKHPGVASVQIIFNMMRLKPSEEFFPAAKKANVGIIARVPLASGLLTGKFNPETTFGEGDHRFFNRNGEHFDKGETFSGVPFDLAMEVLPTYRRFFGSKLLPMYALKWILMHDAVSCVIPGASREEHVDSNLRTSELPELPQMAMDDVKEVYDKYFRKHIHPHW